MFYICVHRLKLLLKTSDKFMLNSFIKCLHLNFLVMLIGIRLFLCLALELMYLLD